MAQASEELSRARERSLAKPEDVGGGMEISHRTAFSMRSFDLSAVRCPAWCTPASRMHATLRLARLVPTRAPSGIPMHPQVDTRAREHDGLARVRFCCGCACRRSARFSSASSAGRSSTRSRSRRRVTRRAAGGWRWAGVGGPARAKCGGDGGVRTTEGTGCAGGW
eukprot:6188909-Pleurochrysis_carterae.AAC.2